MAEEKKVRKPVKKKEEIQLEESVKIILKITKGRREFFVRAKDLLYYEHEPYILADSADYIVHTTYGDIAGAWTWIFLSTELRVPIEVVRGFVEDMWGAMTDVVVPNIIVSSELDKLVPPEVKETKIIDVSELYLSIVRNYALKSLGR